MLCASQQTLNSRQTLNYMEQVLTFVILYRHLGWDTRLVLNFDLLPLKPSNDDQKAKEKVSHIIKLISASLLATL